MHLMPSRMRYWFCTTPVDMRKGFDGLSGLVRDHLLQDPLTGDVFVFIGRARTHIKLLYWDGDGFVMYYKRLEKGRFDFPMSEGTSRELRRDEMLMLLEGVRLVAMYAPLIEAVFFDYRKGRGQLHCHQMLDDFQGYLQADDYQAYYKHKTRGGVIPVACWAHARRNFDKALGSDRTRASVAMKLIQKLYAV